MNWYVRTLVYGWIRGYACPYPGNLRDNYLAQPPHSGAMALTLSEASPLTTYTHNTHSFHPLLPLFAAACYMGKIKLTMINK